MKAALFYDNSDTFRDPVMIRETHNSYGSIDLHIDECGSFHIVEDVSYVYQNGRRLYIIPETPFTTLYYEVLED